MTRYVRNATYELFLLVYSAYWSVCWLGPSAHTLRRCALIELCVFVLQHSAVLDDPIAADVAEHWRASPADAQRTARNWTRKYG